MSQKYTETEAFEKLKDYCAREERSTYMIQRKLYEWGFGQSVGEEIISNLIVENFLNEERYATAYARGKMKINRWGKMKIRQALKAKYVSERNIEFALKNLDEEIYSQNVQTLIEQKWSQQHREENFLKKCQKVNQYLLQKGYAYSEFYELFSTFKERKKSNLP